MKVDTPLYLILRRINISKYYNYPFFDKFILNRPIKIKKAANIAA